MKLKTFTSFKNGKSTGPFSIPIKLLKLIKTELTQAAV